MNYRYIRSTSVTHAQRGCELLRGMGFYASYERVTGKKGCGYSIKVRDMEADRAYELLRSNYIKVKGFYD